MFGADPKMLQRLTPQVRRVLILDAQPASAKLLADLVRALGAQHVLIESDDVKAFHNLRDLDPQLILTDYMGPRLNGPVFIRRVRRSDLTCRKAPAIMVTAEATASSIKGARDAGVHEFLRKPFTAGDLLKRIEAAALKPRDWIEAVQYVGPDRRRFNSVEYDGPRKRRADKPKSRSEAQAAQLDQAARILKSALAQYEQDANQALRAMREQARILKSTAVTSGEMTLAVAAAELEKSLAADRPRRADIQAPVAAVLAIFETTAAKAA